MNQYDFADRVETLHRQAVELKERYATGVTFSRILKIDRARIQIAHCWRAFEIADQLWAKWRRPEATDRLRDCLSEIVNTCNMLGIPFPAIFLLRLKQMHDGEFVAYRETFPLLEEKNDAA